MALKLLFIGADPNIAALAIQSVRLRWPDAVVPVTATATQGLELVKEESPDVVLLHPDFTDMALSQVIQDLRRFSTVPLLVLGHQGDEIEAVTSLEMGADDYIRMPISLAEIMIRILSVLRRVGQVRMWSRARPHGKEGQSFSSLCDPAHSYRIVGSAV